MKVLRLTLKKKAFDVMVTGEKQEEFRKYSKWIESRLFNTEYWTEKNMMLSVFLMVTVMIDHILYANLRVLYKHT